MNYLETVLVNCRYFYSFIQPSKFDMFKFICKFSYGTSWNHQQNTIVNLRLEEWIYQINISQTLIRNKLMCQLRAYLEVFLFKLKYTVITSQHVKSVVLSHVSKNKTCLLYILSLNSKKAIKAKQKYFDCTIHSLEKHPLITIISGTIVNRKYQNV